MTCTTGQSQRDSSANTSKSTWSCESLPCSAAPAMVRHGRYKGPAQHLCGGKVLSSPGDDPASPSANTTLNTHAILLGAPSLTSAAVRRWRFYVPVHKISYRYFQPGCGRSWPERAKRQWCHQVCRRPPRRVEKASTMSLPGAPELKSVTAGQNVFDSPCTLRIRPSRLSHNFPSPKIRSAPLPRGYPLECNTMRV